MLQRLQMMISSFPKYKSRYTCSGFLCGLLRTKWSGFFRSVERLSKLSVDDFFTSVSFVQGGKRRFRKLVTSSKIKGLAFSLASRDVKNSSGVIKRNLNPPGGRGYTWTQCGLYLHSKTRQWLFHSNKCHPTASLTQNWKLEGEDRISKRKRKLGQTGEKTPRETVLIFLYYFQKVHLTGEEAQI